jgi:hypothetical protein
VQSDVQVPPRQSIWLQPVPHVKLHVALCAHSQSPVHAQSPPWQAEGPASPAVEPPVLLLAPPVPVFDPPVLDVPPPAFPEPPVDDPPAAEAPPAPEPAGVWSLPPQAPVTAADAIIPKRKRFMMELRGAGGGRAGSSDVSVPGCCAGFRFFRDGIVIAFVRRSSGSWHMWHMQ